MWKKLRNLLPQELWALLPLLLLTSGIWLFLQLANLVEHGSTARFDDWAISMLRHPGDNSRPIGPVWLAEVARDFTALGGAAVMVISIIAAAVFLRLEHRFHTMWLLLGASCGGLLLSLLLKEFYDRPRPDLVPHLSGVYTSSFPSGHSMIAATVYLTLGALLARTTQRLATRIFCILTAAFITLLVGVSRVFMGVHYPTDVLAGWMAGLLWALLCWTVAIWLQRRGAIEPPIGQD
jgi:undecaprenyl-diphosphatase